MSEPIELLEPLSDREQEIIPLLADGLSNKEIADRLFLSVSTVRWYIRILNQKLDTANRKEIVARVEKLGLLEQETEQSYLRPRENLPRHTTPFVGRDRELDELHSIIGKEEVRLLTILAPGGMGKTRIALEASEQQMNHYPDGVYFVPLQPLSDLEQIIPQIASSTFFTFQQDNRSQKQQVLDFLGNKKMLLCIDNWEHILEAVPLVNEILTAAPDVKIIATSREKLNLPGETVYVLQGMDFPDWETPDDALRYDAVQLLVQAAQRVKPDWEVTEENLDFVARVCRLTQGMPLGILLAASWLDVYSLERICEEIQKSVDILETEMRGVPERQRSIRAVFDYSWERLKPTEQSVLMKMSVFRGGCTLDAIEAVTGANARVLRGLVNKALLLRNREGRYDLHELLRQYATEKLQASSESTEAIIGYAFYFADFLNNAYKANDLYEIEADLQNIGEAWIQALRHEAYDVIDRMVSPLEIFYSETERNIDSLLEPVYQQLSQPDNSSYRHIWAKVAVRLRYGDNRNGELKANIKECFEIAIKRSDQLELALCHDRVSMSHITDGHLERALLEADTSLDILDKLDANAHYLEVMTRKHLVLRLLKKQSVLRESGQTFLSRARKANIPRFIAKALRMVSDYHIADEDYERAFNLVDEAFHIVIKQGNKHQMIEMLCNLAQIRLYQHQSSAAYDFANDALSLSIEIQNKKLQSNAIKLIAGCHIETADYDRANYFLDMGLEIADGSYLKNYKMLISVLTLNAAEAKRWFIAEAIDFANTYPAIKQWIYAGFFLMSSYLIAQHGNLKFATEMISLAQYLQGESVPQSRWIKELKPFQDMQVILQTDLEDDYDAAWERGKTLDLDETVEKVLALFNEAI